MALWDKLGSRGNVEDRRGMGLQAIGGGLGIGGIVLLVALTYLGGGDLGSVLPTVLNEIGNQQGLHQSYDAQDFAGADSYEVFASTVLGSADEYWEQVFAAQNLTYTPPKLVLFRGSTPSECGGAYAATGPHYCPTDETIYLDETFFDELSRRFGAKGGDVAQAYVIAHEVGHHVQHQLGADAADSNEASVRTELQADCYAGLWAHSIRDLGVFEQGEIAEAIDAAAAVGDDRIQQKTQGRINPESWTHGSSESRVRAFTAGFESGSIASCAAGA
jgi:uncharacterized protein